MKKILFWDNDGTISASKNPNDPEKIILPNVKTTMEKADINCIISGFKNASSQLSQSF